MRVRVLTFGQLKELAPGGAQVELRDGAQARDVLAEMRGVPEALLSRCAIAVNREYASAETELQDGDEVAVLPPVSGGAGSGGGVVALTREVIDAVALTAAVKSAGDGAVCVFDGIVRDNTRGRGTLYLEYEAYEAMAESEMRALAATARERFAVSAVTLVHRLGRLEIGETSVWIAVASPHRGVAFEACQWVIDTLKQTVPIWKKEFFADGAVWAEGEKAGNRD